MKVLLPYEVVQKLAAELKRAGIREIGGVLVGEHVAGETFRVADLSVQHSGGSATHFVRDVAHNRAFIANFFARTGHDYERFNYLGEWHSHPSFEPLPSGQDIRAMRDIVEDPNVGVNFAVLLIVTLARRSSLRLSGTAFRANASPVNVDIKIEGGPGPKRNWIVRFIDLFR
ncbi:Mov34/MPN/PAD-1 family protein [Bradyrhizobium sp. CCGE-LA001]|uniref:Mov34/MPN/PAD-1 family protein n=1 Tax=Bradyrhizobium sp. CCGE-LA001 TaxID=1223566 RepID=UPI0002AA6741|nr:Mov34/MPN/PAD-1 family protein [Bradyrhizobium sp. CCGE-LA001]